MSQRNQGAELQLHEAEFELEREEYLMSISTRLQSALKKLLITITETSTEVRQAQRDKSNPSLQTAYVSINFYNHIYI